MLVSMTILPNLLIPDFKRLEKEKERWKGQIFVVDFFNDIHICGCSSDLKQTKYFLCISIKAH